jgi:hypothetical protein
MFVLEQQFRVFDQQGQSYISWRSIFRAKKKADIRAEIRRLAAKGKEPFPRRMTTWNRFGPTAVTNNVPMYP